MHERKSVFILVFFLLLWCLNTSAQDELAADSLKTNTTSVKVQPKDTRPIHDRIAFDINTSFWINTSSTFFEFSPVITYKFPGMLSIGAGPTYVYNRDRINRVDLHGWGGKVFSRAQLTNWFYAYTEYQGIDNQYISSIDLPTNKVNTSSGYVDSWFLSLGVNIRLGKRHGINMQALYDLLHDDITSPYLSAWTYRIGFGF